MTKENILWKLEGLHTVETAAEELGYTKQATINLLSKLKKQGHVTTSGGGKQKRLYKITIRKQRKRDLGMFDIINKYSPNMKLNPWYDHQVHGKYGPEEALVDAIQTRSFRAILASLNLFNHITDWKKLYALARKKNIWQEIEALYDLAKMHFRVKKIPKTYTPYKPIRWKAITQLHHRHNFPDIEKKWHVHIPFNEKDFREL